MVAKSLFKVHIYDCGFRGNEYFRGFPMARHNHHVATLIKDDVAAFI